ncbi:ABC transporter permease [Rhodovastum atsumiense]|uniref:ABC transporter permease n=1 Tax=Rhodovastum atsumiense TaxID=504468 RepID=A0A5M6IW13_9PROT|nr:ABC transporter permease [Rhodovastum atsumiense]KAA5612139.1 ABC transporter permease [Rhodovastum atsumiense]CAH2603918.1 ABC transporter permease [Rhodovastum atsumiense]
MPPPPLARAGLRLAHSAVVLWAAFTLSFLILYVLPSDPVSIMLNQAEQSMAAAAQVAALRAEYHLDQPLVVQYGLALWRALHLDFGRSIQSGQPVAALLAQAMPATAALAGAALSLALLTGTAIALLASLAGGPARRLLHALPAVGISMPTFWVGLVLLEWLSFRLTLFPAMDDGGARALVLPAVTLAVPTAAVIAQVLGRSLAGVWRQPFIEAIRAKGLTRLRMLFVHVLPNAAVPLLTMAGVIAGHLLAGAVVTETVFSREGIGRLAQGAVAAKDIPMVQGVVVLAAVVFVGVNLMVDLLYPLLDPRIGLARRTGRP